MNFRQNSHTICKKTLENDDFQNKSKPYKAPDDYKFHCFNATDFSFNVFIQVDTDRLTNHTRTIFSDKWEKMPFGICYPLSNFVPTKPQNLPLMLKIAKALSKGLNVRVDLYNLQGIVMVGELTFTHGGGSEKFTPNEWDKKFGEMWIVRHCGSY